MRVPLITAMLFALLVPAHADCFPSANAVRAAHPGSYPKWRLRVPGHEGQQCWYAASEGKVTDADASRGAGHEITPVSATAVPRPRPRSQEAPAETEREPLPAAKPASEGEARSILMFGTPMKIDATWEELFAGRERR
jgi:hypothetical protein